MSEEWGPWIEHDGKGCPCVGALVNVQWCDSEYTTGIAGSAGGSGWDVQKEPLMYVVRYRIRKPKGLTMLERVARDATAPIEQVDA